MSETGLQREVFMTKLVAVAVVALGLGLGCAAPTLDARGVVPTTTEYEPSNVERDPVGCTTTAAGASVSVDSPDGGQNAVHVRPGPVELNGIGCTTGGNLTGGSGWE